MNDKEIKHLIKLNYRLMNNVQKKTKWVNVYKNAVKSLEGENENIRDLIEQKTKEVEKLMEER